MPSYLGIDCGSVSLNLVLATDEENEPISIYRRIRSRPLAALVESMDELILRSGHDVPIAGALVTGSARDLFARVLGIPAVNEITAHATGAYEINPEIRTIIEIGGQDSKFMRIDPPGSGLIPKILAFRMNEVCAAGTGAFLDEQSARLGISVESFGELALQSSKPVPIAGRCAVFAKTDMIHQAQEGTPIPDILMGLALALVRNYTATLVRGEPLVRLVSLQGGVMNNRAVVEAFRRLLDIPADQITIPPHFEVLGALGCATLARREKTDSILTLLKLKELAGLTQGMSPLVTCLQPLDSRLNMAGSSPLVT
jgi:predicted CoA-substrate-specific enzyme activase